MAKLFKNENFWQDFHDRLQDDSDEFQDKLDNIKEMIEDTKYDYQFNSDAQRTYKMVSQLDRVMEKLFDGIAHERLDEEKLNNLTELCRKINEDLMFQEIRDLQVHDKHHENGATNSHKKKTQVHAGQADDAIPDSKEVSPEKHHLHEEHGVKKESYEEIGKEQKISPSKQHSDVLLAKRTEGDESAKPTTNDLKKASSGHELSLKQLSSTDNTSQEAGKTTAHTEKTSKREINIEESKDKSPEQIPLARTASTHTDIRKEFDDTLNLLKYNYQEHKLEDAVDQLTILRGIKKSDGLQHDFKVHIESVFKENSDLFTTIDEEMKEVNYMLHQLQDEEGWNLEKVKKGFTVKYKKNANDTIALRFEGNIDVPVFNVLCLIYEPDGHPLWIPFCSKSTEIKKIHRSCKAIYQKYGFPLPLSDRECYMYGYGVDRFNRNGSVLCVCKSYHDDKTTQKKFGLEVPEKSKHVRMDIEYMASEIIPCKGQD